jgi:hypothetical protein
MHPRFEEVDIEDLCAELNSKVKIVGVPVLEFIPPFVGILFVVVFLFISRILLLHFSYPSFTSFPLSFFHFTFHILLLLHFLTSSLFHVIPLFTSSWNIFSFISFPRTYCFSSEDPRLATLIDFSVSREVAQALNPTI